MTTLIMDEEFEDYYYYFNQNETENDTSGLTEASTSNPSSTHIVLSLLYSLIFLSGFWGNLFVIIVVKSKGKRGGRLVDTFVVNLALADLVFVLTLPLWAISSSQKDNWDFGPVSNVLCKLSSYIIAVNRFANIFFLTCMSIDRYLAIVKMLDSSYLRSSQCIHITCAALWVVSLFLGIPYLLYRRVQPSFDGHSCQEDKDSKFFLGMNLVLVFITFILPVLIIVLCYGTIIMHLNKHCATAGNPRTETRRRHSLKMVLCIIVAFVVSWLPYNTFKSIITISTLSSTKFICETNEYLCNGLRISSCLAFFNSCMNPAIYFFLDHHFRRRAQFVFHSCNRKTKQLQSFNSSASFTNGGTSESCVMSGGRTRLMTL